MHYGLDAWQLFNFYRTLSTLKDTIFLSKILKYPYYIIPWKCTSFWFYRWINSGREQTDSKRQVPWEHCGFPLREHSHFLRLPHGNSKMTPFQASLPALSLLLSLSQLPSQITPPLRWPTEQVESLHTRYGSPMKAAFVQAMAWEYWQFAGGQREEEGIHVTQMENSSSVCL